MRYPLSIVVFLTLCLGPVLAAPDLTITETSLAIEIDVSIDQRASEVPTLFDHLKSEAETLASEYRATAEEDFAERGKDKNWTPHSLHARYEIAFMSEAFVSVLSTVSTYTGGAHGNEAFIATMFDLATGSIVAPNDLFGSFDANSDAFLALQAYARDRLSFERAHRLGIPEIPPEDLEWVLEGSEDPEQLSTFTLIPGSDPARASGIMMHFPPYQVGSYAEGPYTLEVPVLVFTDYLAPKFAELFDPGT